MVHITELPVSDLLLHAQNPRLASPNEGQREILRSLAANQGPKLRALAQDILRHGLD